MFGFVAETAGHPATPGIERVDGVSRPPEDADRVVVFGRRLLVTVTVIGEVLERAPVRGRPIGRGLVAVRLEIGRRQERNQLVESERIDVLADAVGAISERSSILAEQVQVVRLQHDGVGGLDADDISSILEMR